MLINDLNKALYILKDNSNFTVFVYELYLSHHLSALYLSHRIPMNIIISSSQHSALLWWGENASSHAVSFFVDLCLALFTFWRF
jgi:hypothetical protein